MDLPQSVEKTYSLLCLLSKVSLNQEVIERSTGRVQRGHAEAEVTK